MDTKRIFVAAAVFAFATGLLSHSAVAQDEVQPPATMEERAAANFEEGKLRAFTIAFLRVDEIQRNYTPRIREAETPEAQQQVQTQALDEMVLAVEGTEGINVDEYNAIMQTVQNDPALAQQINEYLAEAVGE